jgi:galactokinase
MDPALLQALAERFAAHYGGPHTAAAYAPGRVEVLGNHTDYNEGFVHSSAIDCGLYFVAARGAGTTGHLYAAGLDDAAEFDTARPRPDTARTWPNYLIGVYAGLTERYGIHGGFDAAIIGNVPQGGGLSSSAALEMATGLGLAALFGIEVDPIELARIGQKAEHDYAGANCGLLDQISSLFGVEHSLVRTDFRSLDVATVPLGNDACFLTCNSKVKHSLVDGEYHERRRSCERAAACFADVLDHPVTALRDVSPAELAAHRERMDPLVARRAAHVVGENDRVRRGDALLAAGDLDAYGQLMFASHESSRVDFENSCDELDFLVDACKRIPGALGARLSGGGFGGSIVVLVHPRDADVVGHALNTAYRKAYGRTCDARVIRPSGGAVLLAG